MIFPKDIKSIVLILAINRKHNPDKTKGYHLDSLNQYMFFLVFSKSFQPAFQPFFKFRRVWSIGFGLGEGFFVCC